VRPHSFDHHATQSPKPIIEDGRRLIGLWATDYAEQMLPLFAAS
jgi:hypothetical protein